MSPSTLLEGDEAIYQLVQPLRVFTDNLLRYTISLYNLLFAIMSLYYYYDIYSGSTHVVQLVITEQCPDGHCLFVL
jgi:hypothetical protein